MRYILFVVCIAVLASCSPFGFNPEGYEVLSEPLEVAWPKAAALEYISDGDFDYWQSPHETLAIGGGDCEDIATVLIYYLGKDAEYLSIDRGAYTHAIVKYHNLYIEPHWVNKFYDSEELIILKKRSYNEVMFISTKLGTMSL